MTIQPDISKQPHLPSLEIDVLKTFVAIIETGSFSKAAERVFRSPSAVSMQIKKLEAVLERPLFQRDTRSLTVTADGEMLLSYARRILSLNDEVVSHFTLPDMSGTVRLGAAEDYGARLLPVILQRFAKSHPNIAVNVVMESANAMMKSLEEGQLDVVMITTSHRQPPMPGSKILLEEKLAWVGLKGGCAYDRDPLPVSLWEKGCAWRDTAVGALEASGREYRVAYQSAQTQAQRAAILADLAIAPFAASLIEPPLVKLGPECGLPELDNYQVRLMANPTLDPAAQAVFNHVVACFEAFKAGELECIPG
ncbi:LysR family transcriptional regulator [Sneathiella marina]|uniref:LysR family transcriptional regulator n=1 Tax=Sneathiella marina TaxID=2950108 RepID=A0ABY4W009_9PROT|nr:LysR family transcriptional regulator [Sneathiella marina]USG60516.1 LysR family transcriptional regulator [Sneathiella marina]